MKKKIVKNKKENYNRVIFVFIIILVVLSCLAIYAISKNGSKINSDQTCKNGTLRPFTENTSVIMYLPAVDSNNTGYLTTLRVEAKPGTGRTLVDIDGLLFWEDTQQSIRKAKAVAEEISGIDANTVDLIYTIRANASLVGGESAGAALTIATIAALENKKLKENIIITGTINHDGTIGPVQAILPKAEAAKEFGATLFLVPLLQSRDVAYDTVKNCDPIGDSEICTTEQIPKKVNISEETGIEVKEVENIQAAMVYFFD